MITLIIYMLAAVAFLALGTRMILTISDLRKRHESESLDKISGAPKNSGKMVYGD